MVILGCLAVFGHPKVPQNLPIFGRKSTYLVLVLSLFPGADLLGRAFEEAGFVVVRGPELMFGQDIRSWHSLPGKFDGVIGGPPCKMFSRVCKGNSG